MIIVIFKKRLDFPLSKTLRTHSPLPTLPIAALHLATQVPAHWFRTERTGMDAQLAIRKVVYRALLQPVLLAAAQPLVVQKGSETGENGGGDETAVRLGLGETPENRRLQLRTNKHDNFSHRIIHTRHNVLKVQKLYSRHN